MPESTDMTFSSVFLDKTPPVDAHISEMMQWGKKISEWRFFLEREGNLSLRTKMGFIITGSGISLDHMTQDMVVEVRGVVFGLNRPSIYAKGQVIPPKETLLHSCIYEALSEINAIICIPGRVMLETALNKSLPATGVEQPGGSHELAQEAVNLLRVNQNIRCFILKNYGVVAMGETISDAGKQIEIIQAGAKNSSPPKAGKKNVSK